MKTTADVTPRFRKLKNQKVKIFWHPCHVCGDVWGASFGENFEPKKISLALGIVESAMKKNKTGRKIYDNFNSCRKAWCKR